MNIMLTCDGREYDYSDVGAQLTLDVIKGLAKKSPLAGNPPWRYKMEINREEPPMLMKWLYAAEFEAAVFQVHYIGLKDEMTEIPQASVFLLPGVKPANEAKIMRSAGFAGSGIEQLRKPLIYILTENDLLLQGKNLWGIKDGQNRIGDDRQGFSEMTFTLLKHCAEFGAYAMYETWGEAPFRNFRTVKG